MTLKNGQAVGQMIKRFRRMHCVPKNETRIIFNILYSCNTIATKFSTWYPDSLTYWSVNNLPPHLSYVSTLPDITQKLKSYVVFLTTVWVALKRTGSGVSEVALKRAGCVARPQDHSSCSKWHPFAFIHCVPNKSSTPNSWR